jgi:hypothetical protein
VREILLENRETAALAREPHDAQLNTIVALRACDAGDDARARPLLEAALASAIAGGANRYVRLGVPELGTTTRMYNFLGAVLNYSKGEVTADGKLEATVTIGVRSVPTTANWSEPT